MKKVLILSASYGEGHNAAARGLAAAFAQTNQGIAEIYDPFPESLGAWYDRSRRDYLAMIEKRPRLWSAVYALLDRTPLLAFALPLLGGVKRALSRKLADFRPDIVVSVYPLYSYFIESLRLTNQLAPFRLYTIVTDSITVNSVWYRSPSDTWIVPNEATGRVMRAAGVPADRLQVLGFPVNPVFALERPDRPAPGEAAPLRVLLMINAGRATAPALVREMLTIEGIELTVTAGRDQALQVELEEIVRQSAKPARVLGWTGEMPQLLMSHHVLIGKAGGAAVQETIAARTPMIITKVVPGQEEGNARLLLENGCAAVCETPAHTASQLRQLRENDFALWKSWERGIAELSRPGASLQLAEWLVQT